LKAANVSQSSAVLANIVLLRAYYERPNFYSAAVYISQSTGSLMFLINLALIFMISFGYGLQRLFYGPLRAIETEQLYDKAWFAVSETLLAMTIFRDDIGISFFAMFLCLLAGKVWQWIGEGRVEFLEQQPPANPRLFHTRLASSLLLSVTYDLFMMNYCIDSILRESRPGVMVMFGFEYVLLAVASVSTLLRYTLSLVEILITHRQEKAREEAHRIARDQARGGADGAAADAAVENEDDDDEGDVPGWEEKGRWVFYLDLLTGMYGHQEQVQNQRAFLTFVILSHALHTAFHEGQPSLLTMSRFHQVGRIPRVLHDTDGFLRHSNPHYERLVHDCPFVH
jgi:E3 ubiquitin-protein ligase synoviolin